MGDGLKSLTTVASATRANSLISFLVQDAWRKCARFKYPTVVGCHVVVECDARLEGVLCSSAALMKFLKIEFFAPGDLVS